MRTAVGQSRFSHSVSVEEIRVFQACMHMCEFVDEWYVLRTTQNGEFVCVRSRGKCQWKPVCRCRETGALRVRSFALLRSWRSVRSWSAVFLLSSVPSCEQYLRHCVVHLLCDAHDAHSAMAQENCPCHHSTIHFITHGSGAGPLVLIRIV